MGQVIQTYSMNPIKNFFVSTFGIAKRFENASNFGRENKDLGRFEMSVAYLLSMGLKWFLEGHPGNDHVTVFMKGCLKFEEVTVIAVKIQLFVSPRTEIDSIALSIVPMLFKLCCEFKLCPSMHTCTYMYNNVSTELELKIHICVHAFSEKYICVHVVLETLGDGKTMIETDRRAHDTKYL